MTPVGHQRASGALLRAPFPWFGGKSRVAHLVWERFGDVPNYVEPFAGSLAVLLGRPHGPRVETVNDVDCYISNFWRAMATQPDEVARWADWPVNEADLHARHLWLVNRAEFRERMKIDHDFCDAKVAGWWVWGISQWIGSGWCSEPEWTGRMPRGAPRGIHRKRPNLGGHNNKGVHRRDPPRQLPSLSGDSGASGRGVHRSALHGDMLAVWFGDLAARLRRVRVCCGDWRRVLGPSPTVHIGVTGVFLDPPYAPAAIAHGAGRDGFAPTDRLYAEHDSDLSAEVHAWAIAHGDDPRLRIALCGYEGEHDMPDSWSVVAWRAGGGYSNRGAGAGRNRDRERIWFSPHCLRPNQVSLLQEA